MIVTVDGLLLFLGPNWIGTLIKFSSENFFFIYFNSSIPYIYRPKGMKIRHNARRRDHIVTVA